MIHFPPLQTGRLDVRLRELTLVEAVDLAAVPPHAHEAATEALLRAVVTQANGVPDPARWTIQERMLVVAHYIAHAGSDGANFAIGAGRFLDYLVNEVDTAPDDADAGEACGDVWRMRQLTGAEALAAERLCTSRVDWLLCDMAARLYVPGSTDEAARPDPVDKPGPYAEWLSERLSVFRAMPESDVEALFEAYERGRAALHHLFFLSFDDTGHVTLPKPTMEGGTSALAPARFPAAAGVGRLARWLGARPDSPGGLP